MNDHQKELQIFKNAEFGEVRTITEGDKTLFCGADVARALGYVRPSEAVTAHCRYTVKRRTPHPQSPEKTIEMNFIPEGDIYRLAAKSELPGADKFERWIFDEVLPTIRATGAYMTPETIKAVLLNPDTIVDLANRIKGLQDENSRLVAHGEKQEQIIGELQPKADYADYILLSVGAVATSQIAADYNMSATAVNKILHEEGIQHKVGDQWILYKEHMGRGYTKSETIAITRSDGRPDTKIFTKWTQKGRLMINEILNRRGIFANMDLIMVRT